MFDLPIENKNEIPARLVRPDAVVLRHLHRPVHAVVVVVILRASSDATAVVRRRWCRRSSAAAQERPEPVVGAVASGQAGGRERRAERVPACRTVAAHEHAARVTGSEEHALAVAAGRAVGVQLVVPIRPSGQEGTRGRGGRGGHDAAQRGSRHQAAAADLHDVQLCRSTVTRSRYTPRGGAVAYE